MATSVSTTRSRAWWSPCPAGRQGRSFPAQSGVIVYALRCKEPIVAARKNDNYDAYVQELISTWHYTEADARRCNAGTKSWLAIPLLSVESDPEVVGIVFIDSNHENLFTDEIGEDCAAMCAGIARFIRKRY